MENYVVTRQSLSRTMERMKDLFMVMMLFVGIQGLHASNKIVVATIGGGGAVVDIGNNREPQQMVDRVIDYWEGELDKVLPFKPDLILLAEACDRPGGLTMEEQFNYYKVRKNQVQDYFASVAKANHCYIVFGMKREDDKGTWWNSSVILDREGKIAGIYNKNFPTIDEMEGGIKPDTKAPVFQCDFGNVACAICFDLNFDELREQYARAKPDIILFSSMYHGGLVQKNWAYSCRSFFICSYGALNSPSEIRNPLGEIVATTTNYFNYAVATINLDCRLVHLDYNWEKLAALKKKYGKDVTMTDPGELGAVLITSEHDRLSIDDMIKEFNIEMLDDYFNRSRQARLKYID
jgi:hypothetical protein